MLSSFHYYGAPSSQSRSQLPGLHKNWEVPRNNLADDSNRFFSGRQIERSRDGESWPFNFVSPASVVPVALVRERQISNFSNTGRFSVVNSLNISKLFSMFLNQVWEPVKAVSSIGSRHPSPGALLEGVPSSRDSRINILTGSSLDLSKNGLIIGVDDWESLVLGWVHEPSVDKELLDES